MPAALHTKKKVKKTGSNGRKTFARFHSQRFKRISRTGWRFPRGIDNRLKRHYRGTGAVPNAGFRTDKKTRFMDKQGFKRIVVRNERELNALLMLNQKYAVYLSSSLGAKSRKVLVARAREMDIKVINASARLKAEERK